MLSASDSVVTNVASGIASMMPSRKPFMRPCAQNCDGSPPDTAKVLKCSPLAFMYVDDLAAACWPSLSGTWVKFVNSLPLVVRPTVNTGMPLRHQARS